MLTFVVVVVVAAGLLACLSTSVDGKQLVWRGGNTNFGNVDNWVDGAIPNVANDVSEIDMRSDVPYTTFMEGAEYSVGKKMRFPNNGKIIFDGQSTVRIKFTGNAEGSTAHFKGVRDEEEFDFNCPHNWRAFRGANVEGDAVNEPPRANDEVLFPSRNTYYVFSNQDLTNTEDFRIGNDFTDSEQFTSCANLPANQFSGINCDNFHINDETVCTGVNAYINEDDESVCMYYNSCPTPEQEKAQNDRIVGSISTVAAARQQALEAVVERPLNIHYPSMDLVSDMIMSAVSQDASFLSIIHEKVVASVNSTDNWVINDLAISYTPSPSVVAVTGAVTAERRFIFGSEEIDLDESKAMTFTASGDATFALALQAALAFEITALYAEQAHSALNGTVQSVCTSDVQSCEAGIAAIEEISNLLGDSVEDPLATILSICPNLVCPENQTDIFAALNATLGGDLSAETIEMIANILDNLMPSTGLTDLVNDTTFLDNLQTVHDAMAAMEEATPLPTTLVSDAILFGQALSKERIHLLLSKNNIAQFTDALVSAFGFIAFADDIIDMALSIKNNALRRRAVGDEYYISLVVTYLVSCTPSTCSSRVVQDGSVIYDTLVATADGVGASFQIQVHPCYVDDNGLFLSIPRVECLDDLAIIALSNNGGNILRAYTELYTDVECGVLGRDDSGVCFQYPTDVPSLQTAVQDAINRAVTTTSTVAATTILSPNASTASLPIPIIGGAGAAVLIIIVVIIIVIMRRGGSNKKSSPSKDAERNVVAFENPMYEDPALNGQTSFDDQAIYNDVVDEDNEGLYDEPAFNELNRDNPLYESAPDLTQLDDENDDDGGYLDVTNEVDDDDDE
eukprot:m.33519 g.33519  ORF g.33519 m.33519 type:complete len:853 (-) comp6453_c0_seq1:149-2707(-)